GSYDHLVYAFGPALDQEETEMPSIITSELIIVVVVATALTVGLAIVLFHRRKRTKLPISAKPLTSSRSSWAQSKLIRRRIQRIILNSRFHPKGMRND
ncbi:MAG TPA: hypothetical protein VF893_07685, partial [Candidatus Bathyarchaeia archaeon]